MRVEREDGERQAHRVGERARLGEDGLVSAMNAVEVADHEDSRSSHAAEPGRLGRVGGGWVTFLGRSARYFAVASSPKASFSGVTAARHGIGPSSARSAEV